MAMELIALTMTDTSRVSLLENMAIVLAPCSRLVSLADPR